MRIEHTGSWDRRVGWQCGERSQLVKVQLAITIQVVPIESDITGNAAGQVHAGDAQIDPDAHVLSQD